MGSFRIYRHTAVERIAPSDTLRLVMLLMASTVTTITTVASVRSHVPVVVALRLI